MATVGTKQWVDGPFPLIKTPASEGDYTEPFTKAASHMAVVHNIIIRGLNAIYIQAPHVVPADIPDFIGYCKAWAEFLNIHHSSEESRYFPAIEKATGVEGIMDPNVQQHAEFSSGISTFSDYLSSSTAESFSGQRLVEIIDSFAKPLTQHLADEIPTILALRSYGAENVDIMAIDKQEGKHTVGSMSKTVVMPFFFTALDVTFEGGIHKGFPPAPAPVKMLVRNISTMFNKGYWRFAPCGKDGEPRVMHAAPER